jgi:hypothetical protein
LAQARIWRQIEERYRVQLEAEGLDAAPRYRTVARDATEIVGRPGGETPGRPPGDNAEIRAALGDEPARRTTGSGPSSSRGRRAATEAVPSST